MLRIIGKSSERFREEISRMKIKEEKEHAANASVMANFEQSALFKAVEIAVLKDLSKPEVEKLTLQKAFDVIRRTSCYKERRNKGNDLKCEQQTVEDDNKVLSEVKNQQQSSAPLIKKLEMKTVSTVEHISIFNTVENAILRDLSNAQTTNGRLALQQALDFVNERSRSQEQRNIKDNDDVAKVRQESVNTPQNKINVLSHVKENCIDDSTGKEVNKVSLPEETLQDTADILIKKREITTKELKHGINILSTSNKANVPFLNESTKIDQRIEEKLELQAQQRVQRSHFMAERATNGTINPHEYNKFKLNNDEKVFVPTFNEKCLEIKQVERLEEQIEVLETEKRDAINESLSLKKALDVNNQQLDTTRNRVAILEKKLAASEQCINTLQRMLTAHESRLMKADKKVKFLKEDFTARDLQRESYIASLSRLVQDQHNELVKLKVKKEITPTATQTISKVDEGLSLSKASKEAEYHHVKILKKDVNPNTQNAAHVMPPSLQSCNIVKMVTKGVHPEAQKVVSIMPPLLLSTNILKTVIKSVHRKARKITQVKSPVLLSTNIVKMVVQNVNRRGQTVACIMPPVLLSSNTEVVQSGLPPVASITLPVLRSTNEKVKMYTEVVQSGPVASIPLPVLRSTNAKVKMYTEVVKSGLRPVASILSPVSPLSNVNFKMDIDVVQSRPVASILPPTLSSSNAKDKNYAEVVKSGIQSVASILPSVLSSSNTQIKMDTNLVQSEIPSVVSPALTSSFSVVEMTKEQPCSNTTQPILSSSDTVKQVVTNVKKEYHLNASNPLPKKRSYSDVLKSATTKVDCNHLQMDTSFVKTNVYQKSNGVKQRDYKQKYKQSQQITRKGKF